MLRAAKRAWRFWWTPGTPRVKWAFARCVTCRSTTYTPRGTGEEMVERFGNYFMRRYFTCDGCNTRYLLYRRVTGSTWYMSYGAAGQGR